MYSETMHNEQQLQQTYTLFIYKINIAQISNEYLDSKLTYTVFIYKINAAKINKKCLHE